MINLIRDVFVVVVVVVVVAFNPHFVCPHSPSAGIRYAFYKHP